MATERKKGGKKVYLPYVPKKGKKKSENVFPVPSKGERGGGGTSTQFLNRLIRRKKKKDWDLMDHHRKKGRKGALPIFFEDPRFSPKPYQKEERGGTSITKSRLRHYRKKGRKDSGALSMSVWGGKGNEDTKVRKEEKKKRGRDLPAPAVILTEKEKSNNYGETHEERGKGKKVKD